jgi:hypothetical protein
MKSSASPKAMLVALLLVAASWFAVRQFIRSLPAGEKTFFYDVSAARLFAAPRTALSPIRGVDGPEEDAFRALVVSTNGRPADRHSWHVAYLEKFSPELKDKMAAAQGSGEALAMSRLETQRHRFLRRLSDPASAWHAMDTPEGEAILNSWAQPGPGGVTPVVCTP